MINKTLSIYYQLIETGVTSRRSLFEDSVGVLIGSGLFFNEITVPATVVYTIPNTISNFVLIKPDASCMISINGGTLLTINDVFAFTGALTSLAITNIGTVDLNCVIAVA